MPSLIILMLNIIQISMAIIIVYQSTEPLNATAPHAGLKIMPNSTEKDANFTQGISICGRFNYRLLSANSFMFMSDWTYINLPMDYEETFFHFGYYNWVVYTVNATDPYRNWVTNRWHSICIAFNAITSHLLLVKVTL